MVVTSTSYLRITREGHQITKTGLVRCSLDLRPGGPATLREPEVGQYLVKPELGLLVQLAGD